MARKKKRDLGGGEKADIAMGPMIDCTFLLLLYFISVSTIDSARISKDVQLPVAKQGIIEKDTSGRFYVDIEWDEEHYEATFRVGPNQIYDPADLVPMIKASARMQPRNFRVVIRADKRVPYEFTQRVMAAVASAQIPNMIFSSLEVEM